MAIQRLAEKVYRTIGASQVLSDPSAVIKELIDNALDAHATSIAVEISANTLDIIQVRDNGHGIAPDDRAMVARPNCTSKLSDMSDLHSLGGTTLGFRGQALASAAEMSGTLTITTRVEGEQVAMALKVDHLGEVTGQERASLPVGTTVSITDFIKGQPVRRQHTLKNSEKCLKAIKHTLQAYAFARPHVRLSLRLLKAKNDKGNWMYAPKVGGNAENAAFKIVGAACASQCTWSILEEKGYALQVFVPRADADPNKISNHGAFISVDGRPVSAARGTLKQMVKIYRDTLKKSSTTFDGVKDAFIYMSMQCPTASYDPNIEPAKDDVLFEDPDTVVDIARQLFATVYPFKELPSHPQPRRELPRHTARPKSPPIIDDDDDFVTSLEQAYPNTPREQPTVNGLTDGLSHAIRTPLTTMDARKGVSEAGHRNNGELRFRPNMYGCDEEDMNLLDARPPNDQTEADFEELRQARNDVNVFNPWVIAKMNTSLRPAEAASQMSLPVDDAVNATRSKDPQRSVFGSDLPYLPTPRPSSPPPQRPFHPSDNVPNVCLGRDGRVIEPQCLPSNGPPNTPGINTEEDLFQRQPRQPLEYNCALPVQPIASQGMPLSAIPDASQRARRSPGKQPQQGQTNKPFTIPLHHPVPREKVWFDHLEEESRQQPRQRRPVQPTSSAGLVRQGELGDLIDEPRALTPPRQNRDIRDFIGTVNVVANSSPASPIERRNFQQDSRPSPVGSEAAQNLLTTDENSQPAKSVISRDFIPASKLAAMEAHSRPSNEASAQPPKRRKTGESRVLREVSDNAAAPSGSDSDDTASAPKRRKRSNVRTVSDAAAYSAAMVDPEGNDEYHPEGDSRSASRRQRTIERSKSKLRRKITARLPLERVPAGQGMHNVVLNQTKSAKEISSSAGRLDREQSLLKWNEPAVDMIYAFAVPPDQSELVSLTAKLKRLMVTRVSDEEMVQDLEELVRKAFAATGQDSSS